MIREICTDQFFLSIPSEDAGPEDIPAAQDLVDTLIAHRDSCVGMAANMIGISRRIIAFVDGKDIRIMFNPCILKSEGRYEAEEGCLSLNGTRRTIRWKKIKVEYQTEDFRKRWKTYTDYTAEIIQHEIDHCDGKII